ncbi:hypothetical protein [Hymenobacter mucosus]|uniref:Uncharacterized protein n=1 Tax=Hymenobacter mucosus TaxID=1411120 RepID=A0A239A8W8_9BACT|nr:hypothetical protein [Hymenobacter mucosus]SNR91528.1 hypothetical protein SAMN06269173_11137 [Hymenobacter mucosus]
MPVYRRHELEVLLDQLEADRRDLERLRDQERLDSLSEALTFLGAAIDSIVEALA